MFRSRFALWGSLSLFLALIFACIAPLKAAFGGTLGSHLPPVLKNAVKLNHKNPNDTLQLSFRLAHRDASAVDQFLKSLYDPMSPYSGHFLTPDEFNAKFGPTQDCYDAVTQFATSHGLSAVSTDSNRRFLAVTDTVSAVSNTLEWRFRISKTPRRRSFYAPGLKRVFPPIVSSCLSGVVGLDNAAKWHQHAMRKPAKFGASATSAPSSGLSPSALKTAYNLDEISGSASGQTLGLLELDGYNAGDIWAMSAPLASTLFRSKIFSSTGRQLRSPNRATRNPRSISN